MVVRTLMSLLLALSGTATAAQTPLPWDGPLVPVDNGRMVIAAECNRNETPVWSNTLKRQAHGMEPGETVWLLSRTDARTMRLGKPTCYGGECHGDYAALQLPVAASSDLIAVVPRRFLHDGEEVRPLRRLEERCDRDEPQGWVLAECKTFALGGRRHLQVRWETRAPESEGNVTRTYASVARPHAARDWQLVVETAGRTEPEILLIRADSVDILWRTITGIGGPAEITLFLSRVGRDGSLTLGHRYSAGGQPCD